MAAEGDVSEAEISQQLTAEYGGGFLRNALRIYRLLGDPFPHQPSQSTATPPDNQLLGGHRCKTEPNAHPPTKCYNFDATPDREVCGAQVRDPVHEGPYIQATAPNPKSSYSLGCWLAPVGCNKGRFSPNYATPVASVLQDIQPPQANQVTPKSFGFSDAMAPIPDGEDSNKLLSPIVYNMDRLANPDVQTKPGALEGIKSNEEILAYVARYF